MFDLYGFYWGWTYIQYPAPIALTANQLRVKRIKAKVKALKMQRTKKGKR